MASTHPWSFIPEPFHGRILLALVLAFFALTAALFLVDRRLKSGSPYGIVAFELARTRAKAAEILESWDPRARIYAGLSLGLDYLYLVIYPALLSLACVMVAGHLSAAPWAAGLGLALAWLMLAALLLDAVENFALFRMLAHGASAGWARLAFWCALPKFGLALAGAAYALLGFLASLRG